MFILSSRSESAAELVAITTIAWFMNNTVHHHGRLLSVLFAKMYWCRAFGTNGFHFVKEAFPLFVNLSFTFVYYTTLEKVPYLVGKYTWISPSLHRHDSVFTVSTFLTRIYFA